MLHNAWLQSFVTTLEEYNLVPLLWGHKLNELTQRLANCYQKNPAHYLFVQRKFFWTILTPICLKMGELVVATETAKSTKPKIFAKKTWPVPHSSKVNR